MKMGALLAATALTLAAFAAPAAAQQSQDCRCVDGSGNEIESCSCFRTPRIDGWAQGFAFLASRPRLGISVDAQQSARRDATGALVTDVLEDGPADDAGIRRGDLITRVAGQSLFEPLSSDAEADFDLDQSIPVQRLLAITRDLEPGEEVEVEYVRDDETATTTVLAADLSSSWGRQNFAVVAPSFDADRLRGQLRILREGDRYRPSSAPEVRRDITVFGGGGDGVAFNRLLGISDGLELVELNPALGSYFGADEGVLVADVGESPPLGLRPGDVVVRIGERAVTSPEQMRRILGSYADDEEVTVYIRRDGRDERLTGTYGR